MIWLPVLIASLVFAAILLLCMGLYRSSTQFAVGQRIEAVREPEVMTMAEEMEKSFFQRVVLPIGDRIAKAARGFSPAELTESTLAMLQMAGVFPRVTVMQFQGLCVLSAAVTVFLVLMLLITTGGTLDPLYLAALILAAPAGWLFPRMILRGKIRKRHEEILLTLPYAIDLLSISVEAGMGFDAAMGFTMRKTKGALAEEFGKTLNEIRLGKPRLEALEDLGKRVGVEELRSFITAVVHASRLGGSITQNLRIQADAIRVRRRQRAQETGMKAPIKMVFPLVLFIFPALFVVILAPAFIVAFRDLF
jgi:tight adherence protein C